MRCNQRDTPAGRKLRRDGEVCVGRGPGEAKPALETTPAKEKECNGTARGRASRRWKIGRSGGFGASSSTVVKISAALNLPSRFCVLPVFAVSLARCWLGLLGTPTCFCSLHLIVRCSCVPTMITIVTMITLIILMHIAIALPVPLSHPLRGKPITISMQETATRSNMKERSPQTRLVPGQNQPLAQAARLGSALVDRAQVDAQPGSGLHTASTAPREVCPFYEHAEPTRAADTNKSATPTNNMELYTWSAFAWRDWKDVHRAAVAPSPQQQQQRRRRLKNGLLEAG